MAAKYLLAHRKGNVSVILHKDAAAADVLKSYIHAIVLANLMEKTEAFYSQGEAWMDKHYEEFLNKVKNYIIFFHDCITFLIFNSFFLFFLLLVAEIRRLENRASSFTFNHMESKLDISHFRCQDRLSFFAFYDRFFVVVVGVKSTANTQNMLSFFDKMDLRDFNFAF